MEPSYHRVEAIIVPSKKNKPGDNEMDDVKFVNNKLKNSEIIEKKISVISLIKDFESIVMKNEENNYLAGEHSSPLSKVLSKKKEILGAPVVPVSPISPIASVEISPSVSAPTSPVASTPIVEVGDENDWENDDEPEEKNICEIDEPIYDVPRPFNQRRPLVFENDYTKKIEFISERKDKFGEYITRPIKRTSSLVSIDELGETVDDDNGDDADEDTNCNEFCCHGLKNGCTAIKQKPEDVTEEVFEVNWLKRIEELRVRESIINDKEKILFEREKLLFKKERELRILERLLKDKLRNAELYLNRCKSSGSCESTNIDFQSKKSESQLLCEKSKSSNESINKIRGKFLINDEKLMRETGKSIVSLVSDSNYEIKNIKNPQNSKSSLTTGVVVMSPKKKLSTIEKSLAMRNPVSVSYHQSYNSLRRKRRQKMTYDDLDSTLSADIGDSSFVVTSRKFNPEVFKKPVAFTRSASERRPRINLERPLSNIFEDEKVLKRMSDNILVSQDKDTVFQDYGLIDVRDNPEDKATAYLDLDRGNSKKINVKNDKIINSKKDDRPISWNEESNKWLQKKRQAYNYSTKKMPIEDFDTTPTIHSNKENHINDFKNDICQKIKTFKGIKKFGIFR